MPANDHCSMHLRTKHRHLVVSGGSGPSPGSLCVACVCGVRFYVFDAAFFLLLFFFIILRVRACVDSDSSLSFFWLQAARCGGPPAMLPAVVSNDINVGRMRHVDLQHICSAHSVHAVRRPTSCHRLTRGRGLTTTAGATPELASVLLGFPVGWMWARGERWWWWRCCVVRVVLLALEHGVFFFGG